MDFDRTDEASFRTLVPRTIDGWTVLEVRGFCPGVRPGSYATAWGLLTTHRQDFAVVRLIAQDDRGSDIKWIWDLSVYGIDTRKRASEIMDERVRRCE